MCVMGQRTTEYINSLVDQGFFVLDVIRQVNVSRTGFLLIVFLFSRNPHVAADPSAFKDSHQSVIFLNQKVDGLK